LDNQSGICADSDPTSTSTGTYPAIGTVAVNPEQFPYGTEFYIPGYGEGVALDTGAAVRNAPNKIDVVMDTYEQAMEWGVQELEVVIYEDGE
jgi:3D (Asp-Asp-Asp) domain-containing protein